MFDTGRMVVGTDQLDPALLEQLRPVTLTGEQLLEVPEPLLPLFPWGGIQRGWSVGVAGDGAWSLALAIWAEALGVEGWVAVVGAPDLGLVSASTLGVRLDRLVVVESPPSGEWSTVVASLVESFDIVAIDPAGPIGLRDARRLSARVREQGAVLFHLDGGHSWPSALDLTLTGCSEGWEGIGRGHGFLASRRLAIDAIGRRTGRPRSTSVLLPGPGGRLAVSG